MEKSLSFRMAGPCRQTTSFACWEALLPQVSAVDGHEMPPVTPGRLMIISGDDGRERLLGDSSTAAYLIWVMIQKLSHEYYRNRLQ